ncbi:Auxin-responsive protein SAUR50, partial [Cucurbita argyrosperma subsp. argyrosperma]
MAMFRTMKRKIGIRVVVEKLQRRLSRSRKSINGIHNEDFDMTRVPEDVKEGHFAVVAVDGEEAKRFVVPLSCLTHPMFLRLLEEAAEEFGFDHEGALAIPCQPSEVQRILDEQWKLELKRVRGTSQG